MGAVTYVPDHLEARKASLLRHALKNLNMSLSEVVQERTYCGRLYDALSGAKDSVTYVEPTLKTNDARNPHVARYAACANYDGPRGLDSFGGLSSLGTHDFRLYRLQLSGGARDWYAEYLYGEDPSSLEAPAQYVRVNFDDCSFEDAITVTPENPNLKGVTAVRGINAIIRYQHDYLIYSFSTVPNDLHVWKYDERSHVFQPAAVCLWQH